MTSARDDARVITECQEHTLGPDLAIVPAIATSVPEIDDIIHLTGLRWCRIFGTLQICHK